MPDLGFCSDVTFLGLVIWREARGECTRARSAVAMSILNRVDRPSWWGRTITEVLFKRWQYSSVTDPNDPQLTTWPFGSEASWRECLQLAQMAIEGHVEHPAPHADSYYDASIAPPKWATKDCFVAQIGRLRFFNLDHDVEREMGV